MYIIPALFQAPRYAFPAVQQGQPVLAIYQHSRQIEVRSELRETLVDESTGARVFHNSLSGLTVTSKGGRVIYQCELLASDPSTLFLKNGILAFGHGQTNLTSGFWHAPEQEQWQYVNSLDWIVYNLCSKEERVLPRWTTGIPLRITSTAIQFARLRQPRESLRRAVSYEFTGKKGGRHAFSLSELSTKTWKTTTLGPIVQTSLDPWSMWGKRRSQVRVERCGQGWRVFEPVPGG